MSKLNVTVVNPNNVTPDYDISKVVRQVLSKMDSKTLSINIFKRSEGMAEKAAELEASVEKLNELRKRLGQVLKNRHSIQRSLIDLANTFNDN